MGIAGVAVAEDEIPQNIEVLDPVDAAAQANEVNQVYCGDAYSADVSTAAISTKRVAETWSAVDDSYRVHQEPYLLFWRGVLAQCINRPDAAMSDLQEFVKWQEEDGGFADLVRQAKVRLKRLGKRRKMGEGAAANYLHTPHLLELGISYRGSGEIHVQTCTDIPGNNALNGGCWGAQPKYMSAGGAVPAGIEASAMVYPIKWLGVGARYHLGVRVLESVLDAGGSEVSVPWMLLLGPELRLQRSKSSGSRGQRFQLQLGLHVRHGELTTWAGNQTAADPKVLFSAGTYGMTLPGLGGRFELSLEIGPTTAFRLGASGGINMGGTDPTLKMTAPADELTEVGVEGVPRGEAGSLYTKDYLPIAVAASSATAGVHVGLLVARDPGKMAVVPTFHFTWEESNIGYPDFKDDSSMDWSTDPTIEVSPGDPRSRTVFSTRRDEFIIGFELGLRFGVGDRS